MNLTELLENSARRWPQKTAFVEEASEISYAALVEKSVVFTQQLQSLQLPSGSRVGLSFPNSVSYVALTFALWNVNAVVVPIPTECPPEELSEIAATMELAAILSHKPLPGSEPLLPDLFLARLKPATTPDNHGLNIAFIRFTSGTTNARKGVVLCHETVRDRVLAANQVQ